MRSSANCSVVGSVLFEEEGLCDPNVLAEGESKREIANRTRPEGINVDRRAFLDRCRVELTGGKEVVELSVPSLDPLLGQLLARVVDVASVRLDKLLHVVGADDPDGHCRKKISQRSLVSLPISELHFAMRSTASSAGEEAVANIGV